MAVFYPWDKCLLHFYSVFLATNNMSVASWGELWNFDAERKRKKKTYLFCLLWNATVLYSCLLCQNGRQKVLIPISFTPAPSKACMPASAQAFLVSCIAIYRLCLPLWQRKMSSFRIKKWALSQHFLEGKIFDRYIISMDADSMSLWRAQIKSDVTHGKQC